MLAASLTDYAHRDGCMVMGLDAGAVPVALEVAHALNLPLERFPAQADIVKKRYVLLVAEGIVRARGANDAIGTLKNQGARRVIVATPVVSRASLADLWPVASDICFLMSPQTFENLPECYERLPEFPSKEADELVDVYRNRQYLEPSLPLRDLFQISRAQDGASGTPQRGNSRTSPARNHAHPAHRKPDRL